MQAFCASVLAPGFRWLALRTQLAWALTARHRDWRAWTFRSYRLAVDGAEPLTGSYELYDKPRPNGEWTIE